MLPTIGSLCHYYAAGQGPHAALVCYVHGKDSVTVTWWSNTGQMSVSQTCPFVQPGDPNPPPEYATPLPGGPTATPAKGHKP